MTILSLPKLLTEREASEALTISVDTLQRLRKAGRITFRFIGRRVRFTEADLAAYIEGAKIICEIESKDSSSGNSGSTSAQKGRFGTAPGSMQNLGKPDALACAALILKKQK